MFLSYFLQEGYMSRKVDLITGGAGFIGSHLIDRLLKEGRQVRVLDNLSNGSLRNIESHRENSNFEFINGDVSNATSIRGICNGVDHVYHLAALADIVPSINAPEAYFRSNVNGTFNILQEAKEANVGRFIYAASSSCYGIPEIYPTDESAEIRPQYPYALTKRMGEELVLHWAQVYDMPTLALRLFNVYGPRARTGGTYGAVFGVFLAQLISGKAITIVGDGEQTRDFTFVSDVVDAFIVAANSNISGEAMNVGSRNTYSVNRLVELLGTENTITIPKRPGEPDCTWADVSKIERLLGWKSSVSFEEGVNIMLENIDYWRDAPVWTESRIKEATKDWFKYLGK